MRSFAEQEGTVVVELTGDLDMSRCDEFRALARQTIRAAPASVVLDLTRLSFLDSRG